MGYPIKQSQTAQPLLFLMVDSADHITPKTGLSPTVTLSKNGGSFASPAGAVSEVGSGWYKVAGNATDANTLGPLVLHATGSGADPTDDRFDVVAFDPQDTVRLGLTALPNAAPDAAGGLPISDAGGLDLDTLLGRLDAAITSRLAPTTAGRTLDVSAGGEAGIDWANIGSPSTTVGLSGTTVKTATDVETDTQDIQSRLPAALVGGKIDASVGAIVQAAVLAIWDISTLLLDETGSIGRRLALAIPNSAAGLIGGLPVLDSLTRVSAHVAGLDDNVITAAKIATGAIDADALATDGVQEIRDAIFAKVLSELPSGQPSATPTLEQAIMLLFMALRNVGVQTSNEFRIANDAGTTICEADVSDDGTTFTRSKLRAPS